MKAHALAQNVGPQYRGQDARGTLWATACGRVSPLIASNQLGKMPKIPLTCEACKRITAWRPMGRIRGAAQHPMAYVGGRAALELLVSAVHGTEDES